MNLLGPGLSGSWSALTQSFEVSRGSAVSSWLAPPFAEYFCIVALLIHLLFCSLALFSLAHLLPTLSFIMYFCGLFLSVLIYSGSISGNQISSPPFMAITEPSCKSSLVLC